MPAKQILFGEDVQRELLIGAKILHDAVSTTLSPKGRNVGVDRGFDTVIWHDGVEVARQIELENLAQNFAVRVLRESANKTVQIVGDGTTATIILAYAIYKEAMRNITAGTNAMTLRKGLEDGRTILLDALKQYAIPVKTKQEAIHIATISAEDEILGREIGDLIFTLGKDGVVTVEETNFPVTEIIKQDGMQFDRGYAHPYFITDPVRAEATIEDTFVLISDKNIVNINELLPILQKMHEESLPKNVVFIAPDITDSALAALLVNKQQGNINPLCIKAPFTGQTQKDFLDDLAILTGAQVVMQDAGMKFENMTLAMLGQAKRVTATKDATIVLGGQGDKAEIQARVDQLKAEQERDEGSDYQKEKIRERIAKLTNGIAVVNVGGATEIETKERYERAKDAIAATQAALQEGIVPGGEIIYLKIREALGKDIADSILYNALEKPFSKLLENAGLKPDAYIQDINGNLGIDVMDGKKKDMLKAGIIDPTLVAKEALTNAISTAIQLMTTEVLILPIPEKKP